MKRTSNSIADWLKITKRPKETIRNIQPAEIELQVIRPKPSSPNSTPKPGTLEDKTSHAIAGGSATPAIDNAIIIEDRISYR